jgi:hypothetical protein
VKSPNSLTVFEEGKPLSIYDERHSAPVIAFPAVRQSLLQRAFESPENYSQREIESYGKYADKIEAEADAAARVFEAQIKVDRAWHRYKNRAKIFALDDAHIDAQLNEFRRAQQAQDEQQAVEHMERLQRYETLNLSVQQLRAAQHALAHPPASEPAALPTPKAPAPPRPTDSEKHALMIGKRKILAQQEAEELAEITAHGGNAEDIRNTQLYFQAQREKLTG